MRIHFGIVPVDTEEISLVIAVHILPLLMESVCSYDRKQHK